MSTRNISWGYVGLTTLPPSCADCLEIWEPQTSWNPLGLSRPLPLPWFHYVGTENFTLLVYVFFATSILIRSALFWDITQCGVLIPYRRFGTINLVFKVQEESFILTLFSASSHIKFSYQNFSSPTSKIDPTCTVPCNQLYGTRSFWRSSESFVYSRYSWLLTQHDDSLESFK